MPPQQPAAMPAGQHAAAASEASTPAEPPAVPSGESAAPDAARRRKRTLLIAAGAVAATLLTTAAQTYDGYRFYELYNAGQETQVVEVPAGRAGKVFNIEWKAAFAPTKAPEGSKHGPEVTWLQVTITQKVLDPNYATMTGMPDEVELHDRAGRTWVVELMRPDDRPLDKLEVGKEYKIAGMAIVPATVANEVEISFRPGAYRSGTPVKDMFDRTAMSKEQTPTVLRFKRG